MSALSAARGPAGPFVLLAHIGTGIARVVSGGMRRVGYTRTPIALVGSTWTISRAVGGRFFKPSE
jgi:hypothetical protein